VKGEKSPAQLTSLAAEKPNRRERGESCLLEQKNQFAGRCRQGELAGWGGKKEVLSTKMPGGPQVYLAIVAKKETGQ